MNRQSSMRIRAAFVIAAFAAAGMYAQAQNAGRQPQSAGQQPQSAGRLEEAPRIRADQRLLEALSARDPALLGPLDARSYARIALIASGADENRTAELEAKLESLAGDLGSELERMQPADNAAAADIILTFLYSRVLSRYSEFQTRVDEALLRGTYNCVSSAVLFTWFAKTAGLPTEAVETPDHAFCTIEQNGKRIDVETTNPYGVDPGSKRELPSGDPSAKTWVIVPQTKYRNRKTATELRLLALIFSNRIAELEKKSRFVEAVPLAVDMTHLENGWTDQAGSTGGRTAGSWLSERFLNYAVQLSRQKRGGEGLEFIRKVKAAWGDSPQYADYALSVVGDDLNALMKKGFYDEAEALIERTTDLVRESDFADMRRGLAFNRLNAAIGAPGTGAASGDAALARILDDIAKAAGILGEKDAATLAGYAWLTAADERARQGTWLEAARTADRGLASLPGHGDLTAARKAYRDNYAIEIHNRAAAEFNKGNKNGMRKIIEEGLAEVPESALLKNDLARLGQQ